MVTVAAAAVPRVLAAALVRALVVLLLVAAMVAAVVGALVVVLLEAAVAGVVGTRRGRRRWVAVLSPAATPWLRRRLLM